MAIGIEQEMFTYIDYYTGSNSMPPELCEYIILITSFVLQSTRNTM